MVWITRVLHLPCLFLATGHLGWLHGWRGTSWTMDVISQYLRLMVATYERERGEAQLEAGLALEAAFVKGVQPHLWEPSQPGTPPTQEPTTLQEEASVGVPSEGLESAEVCLDILGSSPPPRTSV
jgi:hypothetical protein